MLSGAEPGAGRARRWCRATRARARAVALQLAALFPHRFYLELQRAGRADDEAHVRAAVPLAARWGCRWWPRTRCSSSSPTTSRRTRRASALPKARSLGNQRRVQAFTAEQYFKTQRADGGAVRRPAVGAGQHGGDRPALQPDAGAGQAAAARLPDAAGRRRADADGRVLPRRVARGPGGAPGAALPRRGRAREAAPALRRAAGVRDQRPS